VNWRERLTLYPLAALAILFGFYPNVILRLINTDLFALVRSVKGV
jgi:NADH:ubiquinone oxidoreductase subunit 4 (subunit M)